MSAGLQQGGLSVWRQPQGASCTRAQGWHAPCLWPAATVAAAASFPRPPLTSPSADCPTHSWSTSVSCSWLERCLLIVRSPVFLSRASSCESQQCCPWLVAPTEPMSRKPPHGIPSLNQRPDQGFPYTLAMVADMGFFFFSERVYSFILHLSLRFAGCISCWARGFGLYNCEIVAARWRSLLPVFIVACWAIVWPA